MYIHAAPVKIQKTKNVSKKLKPAIRGKKEKPAFPRLVSSDKEVKKELLEEFLPVLQLYHAGPVFSGYISQLLECYFNSEAISPIRQEYTISNKVENPTKIIARRANEKVLEASSTGEFDGKMEVTKDSVILFTKPIPSSFVMELPAPSDTSGTKNIEAYMKNIFPNFAIPRNYVYDPNHSPSISFLFKEQPETPWLPLRDFEKIPYDGNYGYVPADFSFSDIDSSLTKQTLSMLRAKIEVSSITSYESTSFPLEGAGVQSGVLKRGLDSVNVNIKTTVQLVLPMEYALWALNLHKPEDFVPKAFHDFANEHAAVLLGVSKNKVPTRTMLISTIYEKNQRNKEKFGISDKSRRNKRGYVIAKNGDILHIPDVNNINQYINALKTAYNPETMELTPLPKIKEACNLPIYADWINGFFTYSSREGKVQTINLNGSIPLDSITIGKYLAREPKNLFGESDMDSPLYDDKANAMSIAVFNNLDRLLIAGSSQHELLVQPEIQYQQYYTSLSSMWRSICKMSGNLGTILQGVGLEGDDIKIVQAFVATCKNLLSNFNSINHFAVSTNCELKFWIELFAHYAPNKGQEYLAKFNLNKEKNTPTSDAVLPDNINLPNVAKDQYILPHQLQSFKQSQKMPELMVLDISAGGGKTRVVLNDILVLLDNKKIKKPLVICPQRIVSEWCSEINRVSGGKLNAIPLTPQVFKQMRKNMGATRNDFINYCKNAPPNTIFIASMLIFPRKRDIFFEEGGISVIRYGLSEVYSYPQLWLAQEIGFDYVAIDECQWIKNPSSQLTKAIQQLTSLCKYRRIVSGTLIKNRGDDIVGEFSTLNPAIYGSVEDFYGKFAITSGKTNTKFERFKPNAEIEVRKTGEEYVSWLTKRRPDWGFLLPKINTQYYRVSLTDNQYVFYTQLLNQAEEEIKKDKKLVKLLQEGDPEKDEQIAAAMRPYLAKLEIFINAPDNRDLPFVDLSTTEPEDLISPKLQKCEEIVYHHFNGGSLDGINFVRETSKVIIFAYNPAVVDHFRRNFKAQQKTVFYKAGDDEALIQFQKDPNVKILVAASESIKEGLNLQVASRIIRIQQTFSPGNEEQTVSRVMRPDVNNEFERKEINLDILITSKTLEVAKAARLIAKSVSNMVLTESRNKSFENLLNSESLGQYMLPSLSLDSIKDYQRMDAELEKGVIQEDPMDQYYRMHDVLIKYERQEFVEKEAHLKRQLSKKLGIPVDKITRELMIKEAFTPIVSNNVIPGTKSIWTPLQNGTRPLDPFKLDLVALAVGSKGSEDDDEDQENASEDDDDDSENLEDQIVYNVGDLVQTEYGIGAIKTIMKKAVRVDIPGLKFSPVTLSKTVVFKPKNEDNAEKLARMIRRGKTITFMNGFDNMGNISNINVNPDQKPKTDSGRIVPPPKLPRTPPQPVIEPDKKPAKTEPTSEKPKKPMAPLDIQAGVFDGKPCIYMFSDAKESKAVVKKMPNSWSEYPSFMFRQIKTYQGLKNTIQALVDNFVISPRMITVLENAGKRLYKRGSPELLQKTPIEWNFKTFLRVTTHNKSKNPNEIRAYPMLVDGSLYVVVNLSTQLKQAQKFKALSIPGTTKAQKHEAIYLASFNNIPKSIDFLENLSRKFTVDRKSMNIAAKILTSSKNLLKI